MENLTYRNIDILDHREMQVDYQGCLAINAGDNNLVRNVRFENIRIENFHDGCADQFKTALQSLTDSGAQSLVIDVRHNGGGRVKEMSAALDPLLGEGTIMTLR